MKKFLTKVISLITSAALSASVLFGTPLSEFKGLATEVSAATMTESDVQARIDTLLKYFKDGDNFTDDGKDSCCKTNGYCVSGTCTHCKLHNIWDNNPTLKAHPELKVYKPANGNSCNAFAQFVYQYLFGSSTRNVVISQTLTSEMDWSQCKTGDWLKFTGANGSNHNAIFVSYNPSTKKIKIYESNSYNSSNGSSAHSNMITYRDVGLTFDGRTNNGSRKYVTVSRSEKMITDDVGEHYIVDKNYSGSDPKNIRASKSTSSAILGTIPKNTVCWITEISGSGSNKWGKVTYGGVTGYINLYYSVTTTDHQWSDWATTKAATCTDSGTQKRSCGCGKTEEQSIAATGHSYGSWQTVTAATCTAAGTEQRTCSKCGSKETRSIAATGHKYKDEVIAPTPTTGGYTKHTCTVCGYSYNDNYTPATGTAGTLRVDNTTAAVGQTVQIPVYIDNTKVMGVSVDVKFDPSILKYKSYSDKAFDLVEENAANASKGSLSFACANTSNLTGGKIIVLNFEVIADKSCISTISVSSSDATDGEKQIALKSSEATVTVSSAKLGDVTGEGNITTQDAIWILQSVAKKRTLTAAQKSAADVTKDGNVTTQDAIWILQSIVGKRVL